ncbi:MAG: xylulose kinase [Sporichthyaceae bacterium]|nr:xylulose kinase [Sporichthyaceae bacterium]
MPAAPLLVGLDVGTTSSKAVVFDEAGAPAAAGRAPTPWQGSEVTAEALLDAAVTAVAEALAVAPPGEVAGIGVTSMAESGVLLDASGRPVAPVIAWHDPRDADQVARFGEEMGAETFSARTGLPLRSQWSHTKHRWLLDNHPGAATAVRRLNVAEWVVRGLGGAEASDVSLASRTGWLDLAERRWWAESLHWSGASADLLPPLVTSGTALGQVGHDRLRRLAGAVLTTAGHDHQAATVGAGAASPGDQLDSCGTAEALVRTVPAGFPADGVARLARDGITVGWHVLEDRWALLGATEGGLHLQRVLADLGGPDVLPRLDAAALAPGADPSGRTWHAALEEITAQIAALHDAMSDVVGPHRQMVVTGGWSRSPALMAVKRARFGELVRTDVAEAGARGAALLAGLAAGIYASADEFPPPGRAA